MTDLECLAGAVGHDYYVFPLDGRPYYAEVCAVCGLCRNVYLSAPPGYKFTYYRPAELGLIPPPGWPEHIKELSDGR